MTARVLPAREVTLGAALATLDQGGLVAIPTETVYGVAADATNPSAVARVFAAKGRPAFNPLIAHVTGLAAAEALGVFDARARALAQAFWPGPLTLVVPAAPDGGVCELARAGLSTLALRAPAHPFAQALLAAFGKPLAAPSANRSGRISPTTAAHVAEELGEVVDLIVNGGPCPVGVESTIVAVLPGAAVRLLRPGGLARAQIEAVVGPIEMASPGSGPQAPGMLESHYAPAARLRLNAATPEAGEAYLAFGADAPTGALNLSPRGDLTEAAANLYAHLRRLDATGAAVIAVAPIPKHGLGEAIADRLARAAAPRG